MKSRNLLLAAAAVALIGAGLTATPAFADHGFRRPSCPSRGFGNFGPPQHRSFHGPPRRDFHGHPGNVRRGPGPGYGRGPVGPGFSRHTFYGPPGGSVRIYLPNFGLRIGF